MQADNPKQLIINLNDINSEKELLEQLISQFNFPELYDKSWEGFEDHLFYDPMMRIPKTLLIKGISSLNENIPETSKKFKLWIEGFSKTTIIYSNE